MNMTSYDAASAFDDVMKTLSSQYPDMTVEELISLLSVGLSSVISTCPDKVSEQKVRKDIANYILTSKVNEDD